jgi:NADH-quinone oxidoreductase subunit D
MLARNGIWMGRTVGIGRSRREEASTPDCRAPMLRASGVAYDVRKDVPYLDYETYDFDVPVGTQGDVYDRYLVRVEEMRRASAFSSRRCSDCPDGPLNVDDPRSSCRPRRATSQMESMIHHFKLVMEGPRPAGRRGVRAGGEPQG